MATRVFLLRHGETCANIEQRYQGKTQSELSELGISEAKELSKFLSKERFSAVYSSTLTRSFHTARIIAAAHELEVIQVKDLIERDYGVWENMTFDEIRKKYPSMYSRWLSDPGKTKITKAESLDALQKRGVAAIDKIVKSNLNKTVCVVGHGGMNRAILFHYMNIGLNNFWRIKQDNCCVNIIEFDKIPMITLLNSTAFLGEKRIKPGYY
jgi:broad specificity phosphatase PhoE